MKITPLSSGGLPGTDLGSVHVGRTASPEKMERAKRIAQGISLSESDTPTEFNTKPKPQELRHITMKTNRSPDRPIAQEEVAEPIQESATETPSEISPVIEDTKPLSPQFAELAKQRRALQVKEKEIADREKALATQPTPNGVEELTARLKSQPLSVLQEFGVTYDKLTEDLLAGQSGFNPEIQALKAELKAIKEGVDKTFSDKEAHAEQQVLAEIQREVEQRVLVGDDFEMIRVTGSQSEVKELIRRTFHEKGEYLSTEEAMRLIEEDLINETLKTASTNKVRSRLTPPPTPPQQQPTKQIRTLTNRDTAKPVMDRRSRALAAALGTLRK